ncbi:MAG: HEAT repeat domain-containing protein [Bacillota bacterium]|nr:HEAT repeat domain-containing protein [Bacillota bacterium]
MADILVILSVLFFAAGFLFLFAFLVAKILNVQREKREADILEKLRQWASAGGRHGETSFVALGKNHLPLALRALQDIAAAHPERHPRGEVLFHRLDGWARIRALAQDPREGKRREGAILLGLAPSFLRAPPSLFPALLADPATEVRKAALLSLLARKEQEGAQVAFAALWHYRDGELYRYGREALRLAGTRATGLLLQALSAKEPEVRWLAIEALGDTAHAGVLPHLLALALFSADEEARIRATRSLRRYPSPQAEEALLRLARESRWEIRAQAARSLGLLGNSRREILLTLAQLARDDAYWVRNNAVSALESLGPAGKGILESLLDDPDPFTRQRVAEVFALAPGWKPA